MGSQPENSRQGEPNPSGSSELFGSVPNCQSTHCQWEWAKPPGCLEQVDTAYPSSQSPRSGGMRGGRLKPVETKGGDTYFCGLEQSVLGTLHAPSSLRVHGHGTWLTLGLAAFGWAAREIPQGLF